MGEPKGKVAALLDLRKSDPIGFDELASLATAALAKRS